MSIGEDVREGKPNPEAFLRTAELLNIDPKECAAVEDVREIPTLQVLRVLDKF